VRYLNDITAAQADFVVDEQDFHQSVRQAMFETMVELVGKISAVNAEAGLRILRMALDFSDLPNKEEMAAEVKNMLGIVDEKDLEKMTPEQRGQYQEELRKRQEARDIQHEQLRAALTEQQAKVDKALADAENARATAAEHLAKAIATQQASLAGIADLQSAVGELTALVQQVVPNNGSSAPAARP
jgi:hypothetical protein